ncbi:MAG: putative toxin-antitoxin system toxin component, PIN family [Gammaproteobacteria bacterium]
MSSFTAVYDACVFYPAPVRDILIRMALTGMFRAKWTNQIQDEWTRNLLKNRKDIAASRLQKTVSLMNEHIKDCLVENYEFIIKSVTLPDPDDRHVLAAAIISNADVIVTENLKDFPVSELSKYGIEAQSPDIFLSHLYDLKPEVFCLVVHQLRSDLNKPSLTAEELLQIFYKHGLPMTVNKLKNCIDLI